MKHASRVALILIIIGYAMVVCAIAAEPKVATVTVVKQPTPTTISLTCNAQGLVVATVTKGTLTIVPPKAK